MTDVSDATDDTDDTDDTTSPAANAGPTGMPDAVAEAPQARTPAPRTRRWRIDNGLLVVSLVIAVGLALVVRGLAVGITGDERAGLPDLIEEVDPVPEAVQVLSQTRVFADLQSGYTGVFVIDGVELPTTDIQDVAGGLAAEPGQQIDLPPTTIFEGGNNTLTFVPNDAAPITEFSTGEHRVQVIYWQIEVGRERARSFIWTFNVV